MSYVTLQRQTFLTIAWCLAGLLLWGSLFNVLPVVKDSAVFAEERVLEVDDDDRSNSLDLDEALHSRIDEHPTSQTWQEVQVFYCVHMIAAVPSANLQRGPPCW